MIHLRKLLPKDAEGIQEWMKDPEVNCFFRFNPQAADRKNILAFIEQSQTMEKDRHYSVTDDSDQYLGTISLKNIDIASRNAEYAVSFRRCAQGTGAAFQATLSIMKIAFDELKLRKVYLNVLSDNQRAIHFYEKFGFIKEGVFKDHLFLQNQYKTLYWYAYFNLDENED